jgi:spermidine synthase
MTDAAPAEPAAEPTGPAPAPLRAGALYLNVFVVATCGLVYELLAGTLGSYLLGDSVTQFSLVIGLYLSAMGVGAWLSRFLEKDLAKRFLEIELAVAVVGGLSAPVLFIAFGSTHHFQFVLLAFVFAIGTLVGLEIPLLMRLLEGQLAFKDVVSRVLTFDYVGALAAAIMFPLVFIPQLGLVRTSLLMGLLNAGIALWGSWLLSDRLGKSTLGVRIRAVLVMAGMIAGLVFADRLTKRSEDAMYPDPIVYTETSPYQRILVTKGRNGFTLYLNGNIQLASVDEYRYHESLVHPAMISTDRPPKRVLILGGGDGLALREVLAHPSVEHVTLVDLDPAMTALGKNFPPLAELSKGALDDPRVTVINDDAMNWVKNTTDLFDVMLVDFPDPNTYGLSKLYSTAFYTRAVERLAPGATIGLQATSPLVARTSYWCVVETMRASGLYVHGYQVAIPTFGVWGFALAKKTPFEPPTKAPPLPSLRFINDGALSAMFVMPADMTPVPVEINRLDNPVIVGYYEADWKRWQRL